MIEYRINVGEIVGCAAIRRENVYDVSQGTNEHVVRERIIGELASDRAQISIADLESKRGDSSQHSGARNNRMPADVQELLLMRLFDHRAVCLRAVIEQT